MIEEMNMISGSWFDWMTSMTWQVSLFILIVGAIDFLIKKWAWPQIRYAIWALVLLKLVIPPVWTFDTGIIPQVRKHIEPQISGYFSTSQENGMLIKGETTQTSNITEKPIINNEVGSENQKTAPISAGLSLISYLMILWMLGIIIFSSVLMKRISKLKKWHIEQEKRKEIPDWFHEILVKVGKTLSIQRLPAIVFTNEAVSPAVYGMFRPVLLLPEKYIENLSEEEVEHVLMHELAHVKRGDLIIHGICLILQIIYWFNPLLIWVRKQMKHIREICCDLTIANILRERTNHYKQTLVNTARELLTESVEPGMGLLGLFEEPFQLIERIKWLGKESWKNRKLAIGTTIIISFSLTAFVLPMGEITYNLASPNISTLELGEKSDKYRDKVIESIRSMNRSFIDWDFEELENYYMDEVILDQESRPSIKGKQNVISDLKLQKSQGIRFELIESYLTDFWKTDNQLCSLERFTYKINLRNQNLRLAGSGRAFTIWEIQKDETIKIAYSILNLESANPRILDGDE